MNTMNKIKEKILEEIDNIEIIDSHEHLFPEKSALKRKRDIFSLFIPYSILDLKSAGMSEDEIRLIFFEQDTPLEIRWKRFFPYWKKIRFTSFSKSILNSIKKIYGYSEINEDNYENISKAIIKNTKPGLYKKILRNICNIKVVLTQCYTTQVETNKDDPLLISIMPLYLGCGSTSSSWESWEDFQSLGPYEGFYGFKKEWKYKSVSIKKIDDCLENQISYLKKIKEEGAVGVKFSTFPKLNTDSAPDRKKAKELFDDFKNGRVKKITHPNELHYYLLDNAISNAVKEGFIISVHTGYVWNDFRDYSPLNVIPFIMRNPQGKFDLYHLGYPWIRESIMIGKSFSNVYINCCWIHIISEKAAKEAIDEIIDTLPINKIIGFGGDYTYESIENIYGHLKMAKDNLAEIISQRISQGYMDFNSGIEVIKKFLFNNPKYLYGLK